MKYKTTENIERYLTPQAYTAGVYGWRADFYEFAGFTISTGYSPLEYIYKEIHNKKTAEAIKAEILKLEKKLEARAYAFQKCGDWDKGRKFITDRIYSIYKKAIEAEYTQKNGNK